MTAEPQTTSNQGMVMTHPVSQQQVHQAMSHQDGQPTAQAMPQTNPVMPAFPPLWSMFSIPPPPLPFTTKTKKFKIS